MTTNRRQSPLIALLTLAVVASSLAIIPPAQGGPIADMMARHRQSRQMKLPPMDPPFSKQPVKDLNARNVSFTSKLKKRFSLKRDTSSGTIPFQDSNVNKASR